MGQKETAVSGKNRIMIYGPKNGGTYVVEFRTAAATAPILDSTIASPHQFGSNLDSCTCSRLLQSASAVTWAPSDIGPVAIPRRSSVRPHGDVLSLFGSSEPVGSARFVPSGVTGVVGRHGRIRLCRM